jgi:hypothetical protein
MAQKQYSFPVWMAGFTFPTLAPLSVLCVIAASFYTVQYFTWSETEANIVSIKYMCSSTKRGIWQRSASKISYLCGDDVAIAKGRSNGYEPSRIRELTLLLEFKGLHDEDATASIVAWEHDIPCEIKEGVCRIMYRGPYTYQAQFPVVVKNGMRDSWIMALLIGIAALACRKFLRQ